MSRNTITSILFESMLRYSIACCNDVNNNEINNNDVNNNDVNNNDVNNNDVNNNDVNNNDVNSNDVAQQPFLYVTPQLLILN